jgi:hypothetical protein
MKIRLIAMILAVAALFGVLSGCTGKSTEQETIPILQEVTEAPAVLPDLETLYNQGMEVLAQMGDEAPILFPETNIGYLNEFYPGLADIEMKQFYAGVAPVTNAPFEILLAEVADEADVPALLEIFHARMDRESDVPPLEQVYEKVKDIVCRVRETDQTDISFLSHYWFLSFNFLIKVQVLNATLYNTAYLTNFNI